MQTKALAPLTYAIRVLSSLPVKNLHGHTRGVRWRAYARQLLASERRRGEERI